MTSRVLLSSLFFQDRVFHTCSHLSPGPGIGSCSPSPIPGLHLITTTESVHCAPYFCFSIFIIQYSHLHPLCEHLIVLGLPTFCLISLSISLMLVLNVRSLGMRACHRLTKHFGFYAEAWVVTATREHPSGQGTACISDHKAPNGSRPQHSSPLRHEYRDSPFAESQDDLVKQNRSTQETDTHRSVSPPPPLTAMAPHPGSSLDHYFLPSASMITFLPHHHKSSEHAFWAAQGNQCRPVGKRFGYRPI